MLTKPTLPAGHSQPARHNVAVHYTRFVALGDSVTEGLSDPAPHGGYRGWADRVADVLAATEGFTYANLAVRGKRLADVLGEQLEPALRMIEGPQTLVSFHAGANNALRPGFDPDALRRNYRDAVARLTQTGAHVLIFTVQEVPAPRTVVQRAWNARFAVFNETVRAAAADFGATVLDGNQHQVFNDPRLLGPDRLHLNSEGHRRVAAAVLDAIGQPHDADWRDPLPPAAPRGALARMAGDVVWATVFLVPWLLRRVTGRSSGDGRSAKHPQPVAWPRDSLAT